MPPENREKLKENVGCCKKAKLKKAMMERKDKNDRFAPRTDRAAQRRSQEAERPERPEHEGDQLVYGKNPVAELLKSGRGVDTVFLSDTMPPQVAAYYTALAKDAGAVVKRAHTNKLRLMCGTESHQGVAAFASGVEYATLEELLNIAKENALIHNAIARIPSLGHFDIHIIHNPVVGRVNANPMPTGIHL